MKGKTEKLIMKVTAYYSASIGYADIFKCQIVQTLSGVIDEGEINVTILAGDKVNLNFISTHLGGIEFEMGCNKKRTNEPYSMMPISGFVDKNRTSWEIEYLKDIS